MKIPLTEYHDVIINSISYDCQSGSWYVSHSIRDNLTGLIKVGSSSLDKIGEDEHKTPKEIAAKLIEFLKVKGCK